MKRKQHIEVTALIGDTRLTHNFRATKATVSMDTNGSVIQFTDGSDDKGPVQTALYRDLLRVIIRPGRKS